MLSVVRTDLEDVLAWVREASPRHAELDGTLRGRAVTVVVDEPSTRSRVSTVRAAQELGLVVTETTLGTGSSAEKGESDWDSVEVLGALSDGFAIRSSEPGLPLVAHSLSGLPVLNLGDGANEHPSQGLATMLALWESVGSVSGAHVVMYGDNAAARTAHSVAGAAALLGAHVTLVEPSGQMAPTLRRAFDAAGVRDAVGVRNSLEAVVDPIDLLYVTRVQTERWISSAPPMLAPLDRGVAERARLVLHPLPRGPEVPADVWSDLRLTFLDHVRRTYRVRKALLHGLLAGRISTDALPPHVLVDRAPHEGCAVGRRARASAARVDRGETCAACLFSPGS